LQAAVRAARAARQAAAAAQQTVDAANEAADVAAAVAAMHVAEREASAEREAAAERVAIEREASGGEQVPHIAQAQHEIMHESGTRSRALRDESGARSRGLTATEQRAAFAATARAEGAEDARCELEPELMIVQRCGPPIKLVPLNSSES